jgi:hypothetical protein
MSEYRRRQCCCQWERLWLSSSAGGAHRHQGPPGGGASHTTWVLFVCCPCPLVSHCVEPCHALPRPAVLCCAASHCCSRASTVARLHKRTAKGHHGLSDCVLSCCDRCVKCTVTNAELTSCHMPVLAPCGTAGCWPHWTQNPYAATAVDTNSATHPAGVHCVGCCLWVFDTLSVHKKAPTHAQPVCQQTRG